MTALVFTVRRRSLIVTKVQLMLRVNCVIAHTKNQQHKQEILT